MSKAEIQQRRSSYQEHVGKILCFWNNSKELILKNNKYEFVITKTTEKQNINFEKLIFEYFNIYYADFRYNAFCKPKYERSKISCAIVEYCLDVKKNRWLELEPILIKDDIFAIDYISQIIKDRMLEYEEILEKKPSTKKILAYARATNKKMPEKFHNIMIAHGISNNRHAMRYFKLPIK